MVDNCLIFVSYLPGRGVLGSQPFVVLCYTVWHLPGFWGIQIWVIRLEWQVLYASPVMPKPTLASRFFFFFVSSADNTHVLRLGRQKLY